MPSVYLETRPIMVVMVSALSRFASAQRTQAAGVFAAAFALRFLAQGAIENDHFLQLARAHQILHGAWPIRDFVDLGQMLTYLLSASAAAIFGPSLLTEAVLLILILAGAAALTFVLARRASGSAAVGLVAVAVELAAYPRLYNAGKLLFPAVVIALGWRYADRPTVRRLAALSAWTVCAFLLRHDYAAYTLLATTTLLVVAHRLDLAVMARRFSAYLGFAFALILPWLGYVHWAQGIGSYFRAAAGFVQVEAQRTVSGWPGAGGPVPPTWMEAGAFYAIVVLPFVAVWLVRRPGSRLSAAHVVFVAVLSLAIDAVFLRDSLDTRLPDVVVAPLVLAALVAGHCRLLVSRRAARLWLAATAIGGIALIASLGASLPTPWAVAGRIAQVATRLRRAEPPVVPRLHLQLVRYLSSCTSADEHVLVSGFAPEIPVLAGRPFAAGLPVWQQNYFTGEEEVQRAVHQLSRERVSMAVLIDGSAAFAGAWPGLAESLRARRFVERTWSVDGQQLVVWLPESRAHMTAPTSDACE
ncbi:MAG: hypothetical protein ABL971_05610 [Vicinamibacterales bacterium]